MSRSDDTFKRLAHEAHRAFDDAADFVWKSPRLIESETEIETDKLRAYFPFTGDHKKDADAKVLRALRRPFESNKLDRVFPRLIANGNLLNSVSLFEFYCLLLCRELERRSNKPWPRKGGGISRVCTFLSNHGVSLSSIPLHLQVQVIFWIRNCLIHANGLLGSETSEQKLREAIDHSHYLSSFHQDRKKRLRKKWNTNVKIMTGPVGEQLEISNSYSHLATAYLRDYFCNLCKQSQILYGGDEVNLPFDWQVET